MSLLREAAKSILQPELNAMQEAIAQRDETLELLRERLAELELALEDTGWTRLGAGGEREFSRDALRRINQLARLYWLKNPLVKRAVLTQTQYVFGQGVTIQARHALVNEVIQEFLDDPKNRAELTSHQARMIKETELQCFGNLFFVFFINKSTGRVRVRTIPVDEIEEIITNPEDSKEPWFYKRVWTQNRLDLDTGRSVPETRTAYYPDWRYQPAGAKPMTIGGHPVEWDTPVFHVAVNKLSDMKFGVSEIYAAFDWARAYKEFLENWATIVKAYARFAWQVTTKGGAKGVTTVKDKFKTALTTQASETNPPPATASMFIGTEGVKLEPIRTAGATTRADDARRLMLMVSSATGIFEHYLTGDPSTGNLATAKSMERPMELMFRDRQELWKDVLHDILQFVVDCSARAPNGKIPGRVERHEYGEEVVVLGNDTENEDPKLRDKPIDRHIDVTFPPLLEHDVESRVKAIVSAATLDGKPPAGTLELKDITRMLLVALGEDDIDEILDHMFPPKGEEQAQEPQEPPTVEAMMVEAVRELRKAVAELAREEAA